MKFSSPVFVSDDPAELVDGLTGQIVRDGEPIDLAVAFVNVSDSARAAELIWTNWKPRSTPMTERTSTIDSITFTRCRARKSGPKLGDLKIIKGVLHIHSDGLLRRDDYRRVPYRTVQRPIWPLDEDAPGETGDLVERLMGKKPELRFQYIQENARFVEELDV